MAVQTLYRHSLALLTDLYQLTMAYGYWKAGVSESEAAFHLSFRSNPFGGGFAVACGLHDVIEYLDALRFDESDLAYLAEVEGSDGKPLFEPAFLDHLRGLRITCTVEAVLEGTVVFPHEPLVRVTGPVLQAQLLETPLLTMINFQTLIATKAARVCLAAGDEPVIEFGLRRAQGIDGGITASRAAYVGGCAGTSNVLAGKLFGIPVRGTHAHSWVMFFGDEREAFDTYARVLPNNAVFLVDTYDTLEGVGHAIETGKALRERGYDLSAIRLDSGDLAYLSTEARRKLDAAGFAGTKILASGDLDETIINSLHQQQAPIGLWGVGTKLTTAYDQPALGGVYKLAAVKDSQGQWEPRIKLSEQAVKTTTPGLLQVRRFRHNDQFIGDAIYDASHPEPGDWTVVDPADPTRRKYMSAEATSENLLVPVVENGRCVYQAPPIEAVRGRVREQLAGLHEGIKRFVHPHQYPAGLELGLHERKTRLILQARGMSEAT